MRNKILFFVIVIFLTCGLYNITFASKYLMQEQQSPQTFIQQTILPVQKTYTFSFKEMPISSVFKILSNEGINFIYEKNSLLPATKISPQSPLPQQQPSQQQSQSQLPTNTPMQSQYQQSQPTDISELDNILITLHIDNISLDDAITAICKSGDIYCEKIENNKYIIRKFQTHMINIGVYFDNYSIEMKPGLAGRSSIVSSSSSGGSDSFSSSTSTDRFQISENINSLIDNIKSLLSPEGKLFYSKRGQFYIIDRPSAVKRVTEFLEKEKNQNEPIKLSVKLVEVNMSDKNQYGIDWNLIVRKVSTRLSDGIRFGPTTITSGVTTATSNISKGFSFVFDSEKLDAFLKALGEYGNVRIVRDWSVNSRLGLPVILSDVESVPFLEEIAIIPSGSNTTATTTTNVNYVDIGVKISIVGNKVKSANNDERFEGQMQVLISNLIGIQNLRTVDNPFYAPDVKSSSVIIPLSVKFNEVLLLSGFKINKVERTSEGLPILSKLPIIGGLFGYKKYEDSNSEFLILVEPIK